MTKGIDKRIRRDGSAAWRVRWSDETGRHARTFPTESDARVFLAGMEQRRERGTYRPLARVTVNDLITGYIERNRDRLASSTLGNYRNWWKGHIEPNIGKIEADRLTTPQVQAWVDSLRGTLTPGSIQVTVAVLTASLSEAVRIGIIGNNAARGIRLPRARSQVRDIWTEEQARAMLASLDHPMWRAVYVVALTLGLRPGELRALQWRDVDYARKRLQVRRTMTALEDGSETVRDGTKRGHGRVLALSDEVAGALLAWQGMEDGPYIFGGVRPVTRWVWTDRHRKLCAKAGVPAISLHGLRHTCASLLMERGVHPRVVADVLGHREVSITLDRYSHPSETMQRTAADAMRGLLDS